MISHCPECGSHAKLERKRSAKLSRFRVACANLACNLATPLCPDSKTAVRTWQAYARLSL